MSATQAPPAAHSHASHAHDHAHDVAKHRKIYWLVFWALIVGTVITVGLNAVHFDSKAVTIAIALFVATIKASLVAGFFMHLVSEKKAIYAILLSTVFFLIAMMYLIIWGRNQTPRGSEFTDQPHTPTVQAEARH